MNRIPLAMGFVLIFYILIFIILIMVALTLFYLIKALKKYIENK